MTQQQETQTQLPPSSTSDSIVQPDMLELEASEQAALDDAKPKETPAPPVEEAPPVEAKQEEAPPEEDGIDVSVDLSGASLPAPAIPAIQPKDVPDFAAAQQAIDAERVALDKAYDANDIDAAEFRRKDRELSRRETALATQQARYETQVETQRAFVEAAQKSAQAAWEVAYKDFFAQSDNVEMFNTTVKRGAFQQCITAVENWLESQKKPPLSNEALLAEARKVYIREMGIVEKKPEPPKPAPVRKPDSKPVPRTVAEAPAAAPVVTATSDVDELYGMDIDSLENRIARLQQSDPNALDALLKKLPGATVTGNAD